MKNSNRIKQIRSSYLYKLIYPILLILAVYFIGINSSIISYIRPMIITPDQSLEEVQSNKNEFIQLTIDTLYYSGSDYIVNGKNEGNIYYSLIDSVCRFYILEGDNTAIPEKILYNTTIKGKMIQENLLFNQLITDVSEELNWTAAGLTNITRPYMFTAIGLFPWNQIVMYACLAFVLLIAVLDFIRILIILLFPSVIHKSFQEIN